MLTQLRERHEDITAEGCQVIVISPASRSLLEQFLEAFGPFPFKIYGDPSRTLYRAMGHKTMAKTKLLFKAGKALLSGGSKTFLPKDDTQKKIVQEAMRTSDVFIQGGSWIYNETGEVIWSHIDTTPEDHAKINEILTQLKS